LFQSSPIPYWRRQKENFCLQGCKCTKCSKFYYPKKYLCTCGCEKLDPIILNGTGTLLSFTKINLPPAEFVGMAPYCIGLIVLDEGPKIISQIADCDDINDLKIGMPVKTVFRKYYSCGKDKIINYGLKFIKANSHPAQ